MAVNNIDLSGEIKAWKDAAYGKDVRAANVAAFEKIQGTVNDTVQNVNQASEDASSASQNAQKAVDDIQSAIETATSKASEAAGSATAADTSKKAAASSAAAADNSKTQAAASAAEAKKIAQGLGDFDGTAAKVKITDTYGLVVSALGESTAQALIDAIANKVVNELINKNKIVNNLLATDASTVLAGTQGAALDKRLVAAEKAVTQLNSELSWKSFANGVSSVDISSLSWKAIHVFIIVNSNNHVTFSIPLVYPLVRASGNEFRFYNFGMYFNSGTYVGGRIGVSIQRIYIDSVLLNGQEVKESSHMWVSYR